jgi:hypothetical protein
MALVIAIVLLVLCWPLKLVAMASEWLAEGGQDDS